jgi:hypothetical protein
MKSKYVIVPLFIFILFSCNKCGHNTAEQLELMYVKDQGKTLVYKDIADFGKSSKELDKTRYEYVSFGNSYPVTDTSNPDFYTIKVEEQSYLIKPASLCFGFFTATGDIKAYIQTGTPGINEEYEYINLNPGDFGFIIEINDSTDDILVELKKYHDNEAIHGLCYIPKSAPFSTEIETGKAAYQLSKAFYRYYIQHNKKKTLSELQRVYRYSLDEMNPVYIRAKQLERLLADQP